MKHLIRIGSSYLGKLLFLIARKLIHKFTDLPGTSCSQCQYIMLAVSIEHGQSKLIMVILTLNGIQLQIMNKITGPVIVPFIVKTNMIVFHIICKLRPQSVLLSDHKNTGVLFLHN